MATLYAKDGSPVAVPDDQVQAAILSGKYGVPDGTKISVKASDGSVGTIPIEDAPSAFKSGFRFYGDTERAADAERAKFEGVIPSIESGAAALARGATLGLSDAALTGSGAVAPETLQKLKEHNPGTSAVGEVAGAIAPLLLAPEAAGPAEAAELGAGGAEAAASAPGLLRTAAAATPTSLVGRLGEAAATGTKALLGEAPEGAGVLRGALQAAAPTVARGALEGAAYNVAGQISDDVLGDRDLNAERLLAAAGVGAVGGGVLSGALHLGAEGLGRAASGIVDRLAPEGLQKAAEEGSELAALKSVKQTLRDVGVLTRQGRANIVGRDLLDQGVVKAGRGADEMLARAQEVMSDQGARIDAVQRMLDEKVAADPELAAKAVNPAKLADKVETEVIAPLRERRLGDFPAIVKRLDDEVEQLRQLGDGPVSFEEIFARHQDVKDSIDFKSSTLLAKSLQKVSRVMNSGINDAVEGVGGGELLDELKQARRIYGSMKQVTPALQRQVNRELAARGMGMLGRIVSSPGAALALSGHPAAAAAWMATSVGKGLLHERGASILADGLNRLSKTDLLGSAAGSVSKQLSQSASLFGRTARLAVPVTANVLDSVRFSDGASYAKAPSDDSEAYLRRRDELRSVMANPARLERITEERVAPIRALAPGHADALKRQHQAALTFLASKLPTAPATAATTLARDPELPPSRAEVHRFAEYVRAVDRPTSVFDDVMTGHASPEAAEAIRTVYPRLFREMRDHAVAAAQNSPKAPTYQQVVSLSSFFGEPFDATMRPEFIAAMQRFSGGDHERAGKPRAIPRGQMKSIPMNQSESQRIEGRD